MAWELSASPTCPPNGPASTRCLGFGPNSRPFELSLCRLRSPLPGNGISGAEKNAVSRRNLRSFRSLERRRRCELREAFFPPDFPVPYEQLPQFLGCVGNGPSRRTAGRGE